MLGRNRVTVQKWLRKYRTGGMNLLLSSKKNIGLKTITGKVITACGVKPVG